MEYLQNLLSLYYVSLEKLQGKCLKLCFSNIMPITIWGRHGRDHMIVGFNTTYAISAYRR